MAMITGTSGADTLVGGAGDDTFEGGSGEDIARLPGKLEDFRFGHADGYLVVTDTNPTDGDQGIDRLRAIEILRFDDGDRRLADGGEMRVNDTTLSAQTDAAGATLHDGGYVLAWASFGQDGDGWGVYARRFGADGASAGEEFQVNTETADWQYQPAVAALAGGGFVVVWSSYAQDGSDVGVFAQVFDAAGTARGGEFQVNTTSNETQWRPAVAGLEDGGFVVCWQSYEQDGDVFGIFARRFDAAGEASSGEIRLNQETAGSQTEPDVAALPDGGFIAAWSSFGQDGDGDGVYARRFDASGAARGDEFRVNAGTDGSQSEPAIAVGADGRVAIAWSGYVEDQSGYDVFATLYLADGSSFERRLNLSLAESQYEPSIVWLDGERLLATWTSFNQDQEAEGVFASVLFGASTEVQEFRVNTREQRAQYDPVVIASGNGTALVAWTSIGQDGPDSAGVFVQRLDGITKILPVLHGNGAGEHFDLGGSGALRAAGGGGNDVYVLGDAGDEVLESPAGGSDRIEAPFAAELDQYDGIEDLRLLGTADLRGSGNAADNRLWGNTGRNALAGYDGADALDGGAGRDTLAGGNGADTLAGGLDEDTLAGGHGNDTYVLAASDADDSVVEQAGEGIDTLLSALVRTRLPAQVERLALAGSGALDGIGNTLPNLITGSAIGNLLDGGPGADTLVGGRGDDIYRVDVAGDRVVENIGEGIDTVVSRVSFTLGAHVEQLKLAGTAAIDGTGNFLANVLEGNRAANTLDGGIGADVLIGKAGDDSYRIDQSADTVIEEAGGGVDRVSASASFALPEHVEALSFVDPDGGTRDFSGTGNGGDNLLEGAGGNDALNGLAGDDTLAGLAGDDTLAGGSGTDSLLGGAGDDVFGVDSALDVVIEYAGEGNDLVESSASYALPDFVERLRLLGDADLEGSGNALANLLDGNRGNNRLAGGEGDDTLDGGDAGVDTMDGGSGDDLYYVDDANDEVVEGDGVAAAARSAAVLPAGNARPQPDAGTGGGIDTVVSQVSYTLRSNVENLRLDGTRDLDGTGNALDNVLTGNDGANRLDGRDGNDVLDGAAGNDTLDAGNGNDTAGGGGGDDVLAGGSGNDSLLGGAGEDTLSGGTGANRLAGEAGGDAFLFDTAPDVANRTTITDFVRGLDELHLDDDVFSAFDAGQSGVLPVTAFRSGAGVSTAADADDRILYNTSSGALYYDADGTGTARPAVLFAVLGTTTHPQLTAADFVIVG